MGSGSCYSHVFDLFGDTSVAPAFSLNSPLSLLHDSQTGTIFCPGTLGLVICAATVASFVQPRTVHSRGHGTPELFNRCFFHVPQLHDRRSVSAILHP